MEPTEEELALVNRQSRKELTAAEVYLFAVRLCSQRGGPGRGAVSTGHPGAAGGAVCGLKAGSLTTGGALTWSSSRIYRTEVVREEGIRTALGEPACYLKGYAYMVRTKPGP